jgi:iron complex transport system substrate-binding protein
MMTRILIIFFLFLLSCKGKQDPPVRDGNRAADRMYYAQGFTIETDRDYILVKVKNPWKATQILQTYVLVPRSEPLPEPLPEGLLIRTPVEKTVVFSSVICGMLDELNVLGTVAGVTDPQYIDIPVVKENLLTGKIQDVGQETNPDIEKLMFIEPEVIFTNPANEAGTGALSKLNVPVVHCVEYRETHPLGQTEWIRFIGLLFDKKAEADSLFFETMHRYDALKDLTAPATCRPTVFTELKQGDYWYMPGGRSYVAHLLDAAGADYILKDDRSTGSIPLSFEMVLDKAEKADYWLFKYYNPQAMTYKQLSDLYPNYTLFDAFQKRNIYVCNTSKVPYYQELPLHPDRILKDMIRLFHPELLPEHQPRYYEKL